MTSKRKQLLLATTLGLSLALPSQSIAGDPLKEIFGMMTTGTGSQVFESQKRNGVAFGTFSARFSMYKPKVINFQAPELNAGCGGIDFFGGSISLLKKEELVQMGRSIAAGAAVYAFNLAIESICPSCSQAMAWLQDKLDKFNDLVSTSCQDVVNGLSEAKVGADAANQLRETVNVGGWHEELGSFAETKVDIASSWGELFGNRSATGDPNDVEANGLMGNLMWASLGEAKVQQWDFATGWDKNQVQELLMSITGTLIVSIDSNENLITEPIGQSITANDLVYAEAGTKLKLIKCDPTEPKKDSRLPCTKTLTGSATEVSWEGLYPKIMKLIMGDGSNSGIAKRILAKQNLTRTQQDFVENASVPLMNMLFYLGKDPEAQRNIANMIAHEMANKSIDALLQNLKDILETAELSSNASSKSSKKQIDFLNKSITALEKESTQIREQQSKQVKDANAIMNTYNKLLEGVKQMSALGI